MLIDRFVDDRFDQVGVENIEATARLVQHLTALGHTKVAFVSGLNGLATTTERIAGYQLGLERAGLRFNRNLLCHGRSSAKHAEGAVASLLERDPPTAIVSGNNMMTVGVLRALRARRMRVPEDIALVAYDDLEFADVFYPRLTVIAQPDQDIASAAVTLLIKRITGKNQARSPEPSRSRPFRPPRVMRVPAEELNRGAMVDADNGDTGAPTSSTAVVG